MKGAAHLNGTQGTLVQFFHKKDSPQFGRWAVRCAVDGEKVNAKPENLRRVQINDPATRSSRQRVGETSGGGGGGGGGIGGSDLESVLSQNGLQKQGGSDDDENTGIHLHTTPKEKGHLTNVMQYPNKIMIMVLCGRLRVVEMSDFNYYYHGAQVNDDNFDGEVVADLFAKSGTKKQKEE